ncbi:H/ACA ribonucleoprotein complex, subunit Gar1/Naf1 [Podospora didyma]|uniref:H/ACA ribonucleoprotein complex subunit n=1 Tax=Podospora didyma TaxID=330526 RepID=A0AAE0TZ31_9PEZI|nr:H/ACA ribonucleoprotein complex, subunit Gar1/Naf1 [Podospora didyma]
MSFRGAPRGRGGGGGFGGRGGGGGGRGGFGGGGYGARDNGPPTSVLEMGKFVHACEGEMVCESINVKIPHFNAAVYLENMTAIGKVDEILGPINQVYFTIKPSEGIQATSFKSGDKFFIAPEKLLPLERFLPKPKPAPGSVSKVKKPSRGGMSRGGRGGPGGFSRGGRGGGGFSRGGGGFGW